jgi:hypothetical protein
MSVSVMRVAISAIDCSMLSEASALPVASLIRRRASISASRSASRCSKMWMARRASCSSSSRCWSASWSAFGSSMFSGVRRRFHERKYRIG